MTLRVDVPGEKVESSKYVKSYGTDLTPEKKLSKQAKEFIKKTWAFKSYITVEPFVICYILPSVLSGLAVQNLSLEKSCLVNLNYSHTICNAITHSRNSNYTEEAINARGMVTKATAWSFPLQSALPGILILFVGAWTDRTGNRKTFMVLPILGKLISAIGIIMSIIFFYKVDLNSTLLIEGLPPALAGGRVAMTMAVYSYIADITTESERTFRLGIITAILTLSRPIGLALSGFMIKFLGYYVVFMTACTFYLIGLVYIIVRLNGQVKKVENIESVSILSVFSVKDVVSTVKVAVKSRQGSCRMQIILILLAYMLLVGPSLGESQFTYWFAQHKLKFDEVDYGLFLTYSVIVGTIGSFITIYLLSKRLRVEDSIIGMIACMSRITATIVYATAPNRTIYFAGPLLDMFNSAGATSLRSIATKLVEPDEVGKISSLISIAEALVPVIYTPIYSEVFRLGQETFPGAFYFLSTGLAVIAIAVIIALYFIRRRDFNTQEKSRENEVTRI